MKQDYSVPADTVRNLLQETGHTDSVRLEMVLRELTNQQSAAPEPSPELAVLLAGTVPLAPRRPNRRRAAIIAASVAGAMALGAGAVAAANPQVQHTVNTFVSSIAVPGGQVPGPRTDPGPDLQPAEWREEPQPAATEWAASEEEAAAVLPVTTGKDAARQATGDGAGRHRPGDDAGTEREPVETEPREAGRYGKRWSEDNAGWKALLRTAPEADGRSESGRSAGAGDGDRRSRARVSDDDDGGSKKSAAKELRKGSGDDDGGGQDDADQDGGDDRDWGSSDDGNWDGWAD
ncbi:hypothetical protein LVY72_02430 [Arthrobacter sp. I2-34]|uniref:Anti-sigma factor n=1 Tax=Arthrobacter hankyongi TaxID=2904801 RepID=A0ABS9L2D1_9MICC|nr:hypothetical protein [Arthrobacter hankyongi]MCG2620765.1 hypothetical protein [Arthrobacter hankyongi]